ncbi:MAG: nitroreductase family protein [Bacteroidales bacterium]|nr:nitroreductase family protein [Bacteroidales bacterium]
MHFSELINIRQSVRKYSNRQVGKEKIKRCLEAARMAPSASNSQPWHFVVVDEPELKEKVARLTYSKVVSFNKFTHQAPVIVVIIIEKPKLVTQIGGVIKNKEYPLIDIGIAAGHFCLQAAEENLGTCMLGWFNENAIKKLLHIPAKKTIGLLITLGYPADNYPIRSKIRKKPEDVVSYNRYK